VLPEAEKSFNQIIFYGKDTDAGTVISTARRYPMGANLQVVILKEAQEQKDILSLQHYVEKPQKSTLLIINHKYKLLDKRTKLFKTLQNKGVIFESNKIPDYKIPEWIREYLGTYGKGINTDTAMLITEFLGNDLSKISHELDKLLLVLPESDNTITSDHVERNIGFSKDYNPFELNKALAEKNILKANRIVQHFARNPTEYAFPKITGSLFFFFSKLFGYYLLKEKDKTRISSRLKVYKNMVWQYEKAARNYSFAKVTKIITYLREYDMKSKGLDDSGTPDGELLKELIFKILH
jgi:DNA polymerase-3 subunit delta